MNDCVSAHWLVPSVTQNGIDTDKEFSVFKPDKEINAPVGEEDNDVTSTLCVIDVPSESVIVTTVAPPQSLNPDGIFELVKFKFNVSTTPSPFESIVVYVAPKTTPSHPVSQQFS